MLKYHCPQCKAQHTVDETKPPTPKRFGEIDLARIKYITERNKVIAALVEKHRWTNVQVATAMRISARLVCKVLI